MIITHKINGIEVKPPLNQKSFYIEINNDSDGIEEAVGLKSFEWYDDGAAILYEWAQNGTIGGKGIFEAPTHTITISDESLTKEFNLIIDIANAEFDRDLVIADSIPEVGVDWLNRAAEITFEYLAHLGELKESDRVWMPYVISDVPNYKDSFLVTLTLTAVGIELQSVISDISEATAKGSAVLSTLPGVIQLIFKVIYAALLIVTIVGLLLDLFALIIQRVKYIAGMRATDLLRIGAEHFNLTYQKGVLEDYFGNLVVFPPIYNPEFNSEDTRIRGVFKPQGEQVGYYQGTFAQFIRDVKALVNGKVVMNGGNFKIGTKADFPTTARFKLKPLDQPRFRYNTNEFITGENITFQYDINEQNTIDKWTGNNVSVKLDADIDNKERTLIEQFRLTNIPFARGFRKKELTTPEQIVDALLPVISVTIGSLVFLGNSVIKGINTILKLIKGLIKALRLLGVKVNIPKLEISEIDGVDIMSLISDRIGMLLLQTDRPTIHKVIIIDESSNPKLNKVSNDNEDKLRAKSIYERFYEPSNRQMKLLSFENVEMNLLNVVSLQEDGAFKDSDGNIIELISCKWYPYDVEGLAELSGKMPFTYNNNLKKTIIEPKGR